MHVLSTWVKHLGYKKRDNAVGHFYNQKKKTHQKTGNPTLQLCTNMTLEQTSHLIPINHFGNGSLHQQCRG